MTVSTETIVYAIYSRTWQCLTYPVGTKFVEDLPSPSRYRYCLPSVPMRWN
jgi:hypothetical protein